MTQQSKRRTKSSYVKTCTTLGNQWCLSFKVYAAHVYIFVQPIDIHNHNCIVVSVKIKMLSTLICIRITSTTETSVLSNVGLLLNNINWHMLQSVLIVWHLRNVFIFTAIVSTYKPWSVNITFYILVCVIYRGYYKMSWNIVVSVSMILQKRFTITNCFIIFLLAYYVCAPFTAYIQLPVKHRSR